MNRLNKNKNRNIPAVVCGEIGLVQGLGIAGIPVYLASEFEGNMALRSRFVQKKISIPTYDTESFITRLLQWADNLPERLSLLTDNNQAVLAISRHRDQLREHFRFLMPSKEVVEQLQDKRKFYRAAQKHGLPVPVSYTIDSSEKLKHTIPELRFPCIIKPVDTKDWKKSGFSRIVGPYKKAFRCKNRSELESVYEKVAQIDSTVVLQEFIEGKDDRHYSINMYFDRNRTLKGYYIYRKVRMHPIGAGRGSFFVTIHNVKVLEAALRAAKKFNIKGLINIQFKQDSRTGELKLIEMEPRLSVSSFLGPAAGMNLAALYHEDLTNNYSVEENHTYQSSVKYSDILRDIKAFIDYRKEGKLTFRDWVSSYRGKCVFNGCLLRDPKPIVSQIWSLVRKRFQRKKTPNHSPRERSAAIKSLDILIIQEFLCRIISGSFLL